MIDKKTGWTMSAEIHQDVSGDVVMEAESIEPGQQSFPMTIKSTTTIESHKAE